MHLRKKTLSAKPPAHGDDNPPGRTRVKAPKTKADWPQEDTAAEFRDANGLNPRQAAFVQNYLLTLNATEAAKLAGYSPKTARAIGSTLLTNVNVAAALKSERERLARKFEVTIERVLTELARIAFSDMRDFMKPGPDGSPVLDFSALTPDQSAVLQEVTVEEFKDGRSDQRQVRRTKFRKEPKIAALELLGKHLGMFSENVNHKHEHQHTVLGTILQEIDAEAREARGAKDNKLLN
jgi:phage terminase small subunit